MRYLLPSLDLTRVVTYALIFITGHPVSTDLLNLECGEEEDANAVAQHVKSVIDDAITLLIPDAHTVLGAWGLIEADPQSGNSCSS